jgi:hypothetical protein
MGMSAYITIGEVAGMFGVAVWQARRAVDGLGEDIPRACQYRLVPRSLLDRLGAEFRRRGYLREQEAATR